MLFLKTILNYLLSAFFKINFYRMQTEKPPSVMSDYCLDRLFDPEDLYYTPMEELLKRYKKRDLLLELDEFCK